MQTHVLWRALGHQQATGFAALRPEVNQPVTGAHHIEVVLNHNQRVAVFQQAAHGAHQLGNVIKVQAGGRFVKQEQHAFFGGGLATCCFAFGGFGQEARELEALGFTAAEGRHGLAQFDVVQAHIDDGLQGTHDVTVVGKQLQRFADGQVQHVGHIEGPSRRDCGRTVLLLFASLRMSLRRHAHSPATKFSLEGDF